jgi:hypothetical protein
VLQGIVCLGEQSFEEFAEEVARLPALKSLKTVKIDIQNEEEKRKVEALWEYQTEGVTF